MLIAALALIAWYMLAYWLFVVQAKRVNVKTLTPVYEDDVDDTEKLIQRLEQELEQGE